MSNSMTNLEIEDVLSSIRRLVSDDAPRGAETVSKTDGRFVLTPALRVSDDAKAGHDAGPGSEEALPEAQAADAEVAETPASDPDDAHGSDTRDDPAPEGDIEATRAQGRPEHDRKHDPEHDTAPPGTSPPDDASQTPDAPPEASAPGAETLESRIAELEEAVGRTRQDWEPDGSEPGAGQMPKWHMYQVADARDDVKAADAGDADAAETEDTDAAETDGESTTIQPNPVFFRASVPQSEPYELAVADRDQADADPPVLASESANMDAQPALMPEVEADAERGDEDEFLDETALRAMVAEIVREELRGPTGEQITRNMRRMLRREIQRAIALRDVD